MRLCHLLQMSDVLLLIRLDFLPVDDLSKPLYFRSLILFGAKVSALKVPHEDSLRYLLLPSNCSVLFQ
jgi:hypothetical protein